ncbi:RNA polymerase sigma factor [Tenacibaculum caenipelagi]|uniref:RNA polymerase sigma factor n=1 Tax=Tenacibaculum caenipelagi TaxID=1325435 RepID=A0A4R6TE33_9FLAO|nr:RNA polymerase sigma factor [Tenacibaculum caenipelagi]TDQ24037.1 RNA polymerase sigma-70 factor (ECF subfamily) [Tenacibaculum caenipelagi]
MDDFYIDKVLNGDKQAFRYFVRKYKNVAYNLAISIVKDTYNAEDVVQESFIKAFKGLQSFKKNAKFSSWFYRIVVNEAFMHLRKNKVDFVEIDDQLKKLSSNEIKENEKGLSVQRAMLKLNPNEALVLNLFYLEEKKIKEIASITSWSISNVKTLLHRSRKNIRKLLNNDL